MVSDKKFDEALVECFNDLYRTVCEGANAYMIEYARKKLKEVNNIGVYLNNNRNDLIEQEPKRLELKRQEQKRIESERGFFSKIFGKSEASQEPKNDNKKELPFPPHTTNYAIDNSIPATVVLREPRTLHDLENIGMKDLSFLINRIRKKRTGGFREEDNYLLSSLGWAILSSVVGTEGEIRQELIRDAEILANMGIKEPEYNIVEDTGYFPSNQ